MKALLLSLLLAAPALAQDIDVDVTYETYQLSADTLRDIWAEIEAEGPGGFSAWTSWQVNWTAECELSVTATITLPELSADAYLSDVEVLEFERMVNALESHELGHVQMGVGFAEDVQAAGCQGDTDAIHEDWLAAERAYDTDTNHGQTQGAWLTLD
jgi:predicted secreted Zn-dependent protease